MLPAIVNPTNEHSSAYSIRSWPSSSVSQRRSRFMGMGRVKRCFATGAHAAPARSGWSLADRRDRVLRVVDLVADGGHPVAVLAAEVVRTQVGAEGHERAEKRVLDDVLALFVGDELRDDLLHGLMSSLVVVVSA